MASASTREAMSSPRSSHSPAVEESEVPRKKGARGGKRSVTHLSSAQLSRKRANDREAQRNIRQRTKEHIENLEKRVKELEADGRAATLDRVMKRNQELLEEVEMLRNQLGPHTQTSSPALSNMGEDLLVAKQEWMSDSEPRSGPWALHRSSRSSASGLSQHMPNEIPNTSYPVDNHIYPQVPDDYETPEDQSLYPATAVPIWDDSMTFGENSQSIAKPTAAWAPFHPAFSQPSRFAALSPAGFSEAITTPAPVSASWQSQPIIHAWQISTKLKSPVTLVDQLMFGVMQSQHQLHVASTVNGQKQIGPEFPLVNVLFNQPSPPSKPPSTLTEVMARYADVLSNRGFELIPEKLASFMCMYRFIQWQISPDQSTYKALHKWQEPRPCQLTIAHPAWMDLPPWPAFREKLVLNQDTYDNVEFQSDYASNLSVNFPYNPMEALVFENGQIKVSQKMDRHLSDISNMSMKLPFALKYPEFKDVCRLDEA